MSNEQRIVLVTGDVITDHHIYKGRRGSPASGHTLGTTEQVTQGGAALVCDLLEKIRKTPAPQGNNDEQGSTGAGVSIRFGLDRKTLDLNEAFLSD